VSRSPGRLALESTPTRTLGVMDSMTVSELARRVGVTPDTVRYYERIGLVPEAERNASGYRVFGDEDVERLRFVKRAQRFGLQLDEIRELVEIRGRGLCPCGHAQRLLHAKLDEIEGQLASLGELRDEIRRLVDDGAVADDGCWTCHPGMVQLRTRPEG
jgi:DNA-binding transcriptional MerR regulator